MPAVSRVRRACQRNAALQLVAEQGLAALTVNALAGRLGVPKGSFYWHFRGRDDLLGAALRRWEEQTVSDAVRALDEVPDPRRRLELIFEAASRPPRSRSLYAALSEAAGEPIVRRTLERVAAVRIDYLEKCYRALGLEPADAKARAVFAYAAYRGLLQLAHEAPDSLPSEWSRYPETVRRALLP